VRLTARTAEKAQKLIDAHSAHASKLDYAVVPDIAAANAFDAAVQSDPPFEVVLHTASPFHFRVTDTKKDLLDPAINGTIGVLKAIKKYAPSVKHVVITSSFASIIDSSKGLWPGHVYTEADWNPVTVEEATRDPSTGYRASKKLAEQSAWKFLEEEKPNFTISTINPPLVSLIRMGNGPGPVLMGNRFLAR
jgi:nucleoside-diphosphate-sugar epimerase